MIYIDIYHIFHFKSYVKWYDLSMIDICVLDVTWHGWILLIVNIISEFKYSFYPPNFICQIHEIEKIFAKMTVGEKYCVVALFKYFPHKFQRQDIEKEEKYFRLFYVSADNLS